MLSQKSILDQQADVMSVTIRDDGIACIKVKGNEEIDVEHVKQIVSWLEKLGGGKVFPLLIVVDEYTLPTPEARAYIATPESDPFASAEAYVVQSLPQKLVGNFFLSFNKPARPTKLFNSEKKAVEWLSTFL